MLKQRGSANSQTQVLGPADALHGMCRRIKPLGYRHSARDSSLVDGAKSVEAFLRISTVQVLALDDVKAFSLWEHVLSDATSGLWAFFWTNDVVTRRHNPHLEVLFSMVAIGRSLFLLRRKRHKPWARPVLSSMAVGWSLALTIEKPVYPWLSSMMDVMFARFP